MKMKQKKALFFYVDPVTRENQITDDESKLPHDMCDFCGELGIFTVYATDDFPMPNEYNAPFTAMYSTQGWGACYTCSTMIQNDAWEQMLVRSVENFIRYHPETESHKKEFMEIIKKAHNLFREHFRRNI